MKALVQNCHSLWNSRNSYVWFSFNYLSLPSRRTFINYPDFSKAPAFRIVAAVKQQF
jgi:hypothetical protein